jgi:hypothetical protein
MPWPLKGGPFLSGDCAGSFEDFVGHQGGVDCTSVSNRVPQSLLARADEVIE